MIDFFRPRRRGPLSRSLLFAFLVLPTAAVRAGDTGDALVATPQVTLTRDDYDAELARLPSNLRSEFGANPRRVRELLDALLISKTLAAQAVREGLDKDPDVRRQIAAETTRVLARRRLGEIDEAAGRAFDAKGDMTKAARERYLVDQERYRRPEEVSASHILFATDRHSDEEARRLALDARAKVVAGADFNALATEVSEDPSAKSNHGRLGFFPLRGKMDAKFADATFALANVGDVSEPVKTPFGWHLIRLDGRKPAGVRPFDEVKPEILAAMRKEYVDAERNAALAAIRNDPGIKVDEAAIDALTTPVKSPAPGAASAQGR